MFGGSTFGQPASARANAPARSVIVFMAGKISRLTLSRPFSPDPECPRDEHGLEGEPEPQGHGRDLVRPHSDVVHGHVDVGWKYRDVERHEPVRSQLSHALYEDPHA